MSSIKDDDGMRSCSRNILGAELPWRKNAFRVEWQLIIEDRVVASLRIPVIGNYQGIIDGVNISFVKRKTGAKNFEIIVSNGGYKIAEASRTFSSIWIKDKSYRIERYDRIKMFIDDSGRKIAMTSYFRSTPMKASFKLLDCKEGDPSPWLIAVLSLAYAILDTYGLW